MIRAHQRWLRLGSSIPLPMLSPDDFWRVVMAAGLMLGTVERRKP